MKNESKDQCKEFDGAVPPVKPMAPWRAAKVKVLSGFSLQVGFMDGTEGDVYLEEFIKSPNAGIFAALKDVSLFNRVRLVNGVVTWPGEIDLAPDAMYSEIKKHGEWVIKPR